MNTQETNPQNLAAPSVTIAPRSPAQGVLIYLVTLTDHQIVRAYPCRSLEKAVALAGRFITGVIQSAAPAKKPAAAPQPVAA